MALRRTKTLVSWDRLPADLDRLLASDATLLPASVSRYASSRAAIRSLERPLTCHLLVDGNRNRCRKGLHDLLQRASPAPTDDLCTGVFCRPRDEGNSDGPFGEMLPLPVLQDNLRKLSLRSTDSPGHDVVSGFHRGGV